MPLPFLFDITASDANLQQFFFWNAQDHIEINQAIQRQRGNNLFERVLDPVDRKAIDIWLELHQQSHNDINTVLGLSGFDLSDVDFSNRTRVREWINLHAQEHLAMRQALKI
jgi:hypothetical protein